MNGFNEAESTYQLWADEALTVTSKEATRQRCYCLKQGDLELVQKVANSKL